MSIELQFSPVPPYYPHMNCEAIPFRLECEMMKPLVSLLPTVFHLYSGQRARLLRKVAIGSVIPDLLLGIWFGELPRYVGLNSVSRHILTWLSIQKTASSERQLCEDLLISQCATDSSVSALKRVGAITKRDSGEIELRPEFDVSDSVRLIAVEVKLKKWREALEQAIAYRKFADESYVVLDGNQIRMNAEVRNAFAGNGIGLFLQQSGGLAREITAQPRVPAPSVDRFFALGKLSTSGPYCLA